MYSDIIRKLTRQLYPVARAFKMPFGGMLDRLHKALAESESRYVTDAMSVMDSLLPDNDNFTADDATDWERRLGIYGNSATPLADRKAAILRKYRHPGTQIPRQSRLYIETQLQAAGFDVYVYENRFPGSPPGTWVTKTPDEVFGTTTYQTAVHHDSIEHGSVEHGGVGAPKIVNYLEAEKDNQFLEGPHLRNTFFISGNPIGTAADVPANREIEFRQLVLALKPAQLAAFININYI